MSNRTFSHRSAFTRASVLAVSLCTGLAPSALAQPAAKPTAADDLQSARALSRAFQRVVKQIEPAVVHLTTLREVELVQQQGWFTRRTGQKVQQPAGFGSGVIVDASGLVLTNNHVVEAGDSYKAKLADGREFTAVLVGRDPMTDLAVVRITDAPAGERFPTAELGNSDNVEVGDWVIAIGSPFGFANTVTTGIVSAKSRSGVMLPGASKEMPQDFIQTDAAINPGNSGGPLLDLEGKVIGINSAIATRAGGSEGIGFAIPVQIAKAVMESLVKNGKVTRGSMGVGLVDISPARLHQLGLAEDSGVLIKRVDDDSPAARAGLKPEDIVLKYNGRPMAKVSTLHAAISVTPPGTKSNIEYVRDGKVQTTSVEIADDYAMAAKKFGGIYIDRLGITVQGIDKAVRRELGPGFGNVTGVIVRSISINPQGGANEFQEGDVIVAVDDASIRTAEEFREAIERANPKEPMRLQIIRDRLRGFMDLMP